MDAGLFAAAMEAKGVGTDRPVVVSLACCRFLAVQCARTCGVHVPWFSIALIGWWRLAAPPAGPESWCCNVGA